MKETRGTYLVGRALPLQEAPSTRRASALGLPSATLAPSWQLPASQVTQQAVSQINVYISYAFQIRLIASVTPTSLVSNS